MGQTGKKGSVTGNLQKAGPLPAEAWVLYFPRMSMSDPKAWQGSLVWVAGCPWGQAWEEGKDAVSPWTKRR